MVRTNLEVVSKAREYLGTKFRHQGRLKGIGVDCVGLIVGVAHELGLSNFDAKNYGRDPDPKMMREVLNREMIPIKVNDAQPGDVLWMVFYKEPQHLAIKTDVGIIHSYSGVGKVVEHVLDHTWRSRIREAYRFKGTELCS